MVLFTLEITLFFVLPAIKSCFCNNSDFNSTRIVELERLNVRQFVFFCKHIQPILENYSLIYSLIHDLLPTSSLSFANEKEFVKSVQTVMFNFMLSSSSSSASAFDLEALSLNMINNSVLALKQFGALLVTSQSQPSRLFVIDRARLWSVLRKLNYVLKASRAKLNESIRLARSIEPIDSDDFGGFHKIHEIHDDHNRQPASPEAQDEFLLAEYQELFIAAKI